MKTLVLIYSIIFCSYHAFSQDVYEEMDWFSWNEDLIEDDNIRYFSMDNFLHIQHFNENKDIDWEIAKLDSSTYFYQEYAFVTKFEGRDTLIQKTRKSGYLREVIIEKKLDTILHFNPETFEEYKTFRPNIKYGLIKHGHWFENRNELHINGFYKNGKKDGTWKYRSYKPDGIRPINILDERYEIVFEDGLEVKRWNRNYTKIPHSDSIAVYLTGTWRMTYHVADRSYFNKRIGNVYIFKPDKTFIRQIRCCVGGNCKTPKTTWRISDENHLILEREDGYFMEYRFIVLTEDRMIWERVNKD